MADNMKAMMEIIGTEDEDFELDQIIDAWPEEPEGQRLFMAALIARNSRLTSTIFKRQNMMWVLMTVIGIGSFIGASHALGIPDAYAGLGGLLFGAVLQMLKIKQ